MENNNQYYDPQEPPYAQPNNHGYQQQGFQQSGFNQYQQHGFQPGFQPGVQSQYKPNSNLVWAILTTILCCLPFGIVSIVYASKVDSFWYAGNYQAAQDASKKAGTWAMWAAIVGGVVIAAYIIFVVVLGVGMATSGYYKFY